MSSMDVPVVCTGMATPFPTPRTEPPDMSQGVHFNIFNNIWNTNYVLWYCELPSKCELVPDFSIENAERMEDCP